MVFRHCAVVSIWTSTSSPVSLATWIVLAKCLAIAGASWRMKALQYVVKNARTSAVTLLVFVSDRPPSVIGEPRWITYGIGAARQSAVRHRAHSGPANNYLTKSTNCLRLRHVHGENRACRDRRTDSAPDRVGTGIQS